MEENIVYPISIIAKDASNKRIYTIEEYVNWNGPMTITLTVAGDNIGEVAINATKAIHAMADAIIKRNKENGTTLEDILTTEINVIEGTEFNKKQEEADGR